MVLLSLAVDEIAVESELTDDGVHLTKRQLRPAFEPAADETVRVFGEADLQRCGTRIIGYGYAVFTSQAEQALNAADGYNSVPSV